MYWWAIVCLYLAGCSYGLQQVNVADEAKARASIAPVEERPNKEQTSYEAPSKNKLFQEVNQERIKFSVSSLKYSQELETVAYVRLADMLNNQYFSHFSPSGNGLKELMRELNCASFAENLARGSFSETREIVNAWLGSDSHRKVLLSESYSLTGLAVSCEAEQFCLAVQVFCKSIK